MHTFAQCSNRDVDAQNKWFRECGKNSMPCIYVGMRNKYASVNWDCISLNRQQDSRIADDEHAILKEILAVFHQYAEKKSRYNFQRFAARSINYHSLMRSSWRIVYSKSCNLGLLLNPMRNVDAEAPYNKLVTPIALDLARFRPCTLR